ncbi:hypothetical protein IF2G_02864 [Cordyceps javanica]|nr:hypothetical protein IF2G_02864 [Cordyceps javanica]
MHDNPPDYQRGAHATRNQGDQLPDRVQVRAADLLHAVLADQVLDRHGREHQQPGGQRQQGELDARTAVLILVEVRVSRQAALEAGPEARHDQVHPVPDEDDAGDEPQDRDDLAQHAEPAVKGGATEKGHLLAAAAVAGTHDVDTRKPEPAAVGRKGRVEEEARDARQRPQVADAVAGDARQRAAQQELRDDGGGRVRPRRRCRRLPRALGAQADEDGQLDDEVGRAQAGLAARHEDGRQQRRHPLRVQADAHPDPVQVRVAVVAAAVVPRREHVSRPGRCSEPSGAEAVDLRSNGSLLVLVAVSDRGGRIWV